MTISCPDPSVVNPLISTGFILKFDRFPELSLFCKNITLPEVSLNPAIQTSRLMNINHPGLIPEVSQLQVEYTIDAEMNNYYRVYEWLTMTSNSDDTGMVRRFLEKYPRSSLNMEKRRDYDYPDLSSDAELTVMGENGREVRRFTFRDCTPTNCGGFTISEETSDSTYLTSTASFAFVGIPILSDLIQPSIKNTNK